MSIKITLILLYFFSMSCLKAQEMKYLGNVDIDRDKYILIGQFENLFLIYRSSFSKNHIEAIQSDFKTSKTIALEIPKGQFHLYRIINDRKSFSIVYGLQQRGKTEIRVKKLSADVAEIYDTLAVSYTDVMSFNDIATILSENRQNLLIYNFKNEHTLYWSVFNLEELKLSEEKYYSETNLSSNLEEILLSDRGDAFLLISNNSRFRRKHNNVVIKSYMNDGKNYQNIYLMNGKYLESIKFKYDEVNSRLSGVAIYSEKGYAAKGMISFLLNAPDQFISNIFLFNDSLKTNLTGGKNKRNTGLEHLKINDILLRRDGGFLAIIEQFVKYEYQMPANYHNDIPSNRQVEFYYDNILVSSFQPNASLHWNAVLYKNQKSENDDGRYSSYFLMKNPRGIRLIFNDEINWKSAVYEYELLPDGTQQRRRIFPDEAIEVKDILPEFKKAVQISGNKIIFAQPKNGKLHFGSITY